MKNFSILILTASIVIATSVSATSSNLNEFKNCHASCNKAFIEDSVKVGELQTEQVKFASQLMDEMLQKTLKKIAPICTEQDVELLKDAMCFFVEANMCRAGSKLIELPPFTSNTRNIDTDLQKRLAGRVLTTPCLTGYPR